MATWIIGHFPPHTVYVEPYCGAASVLLRKPKSYAEVINDFDGDVVNLFRVLRDPVSASALIRAVQLTPFAREEFAAAYAPTDDLVERARRLIVRSYMGFGSGACSTHRRTGFRNTVTRNYTTPSLDWATYPPALAQIAERIQSGVQIEHRPALQVIARCDSAKTLIYADPPYVHATRSAKRGRGEMHHTYAHEMDDAAHAELLDVLASAKGMVVLSGYATPLYAERLKGWTLRQRRAMADGARERTECLWLNPATVAGLAHG